MARRNAATNSRDIGVDAVYGSDVVQKFINIVMWRGKKGAARAIVYDALAYLGKKTQGDKDKALELFMRALENATPIMEVRPRRVGGSVYQVPVEVPVRRARSLAMRWLITAAKARKDKTMGLRLGNEMFEALENRGGAVKKKQDVHKMAESNRAFAHFAW